MEFPSSPPNGFFSDYQCVNTLCSLKCGYIKQFIRYISKLCYHSSKSWQAMRFILSTVLNVACSPPLSHYPFISPCLYSASSVCTDKVVFHTHLTDTDPIRGNHSSVGEKMNDMEIMRKNVSTIKSNFYPQTKQHLNLPPWCLFKSRRWHELRFSFTIS